jgi:hypothetical protein
MLGPVVHVARGRDLRTEPDGSATTLDEVRVDAEVDYVGGSIITAISIAPHHDVVSQLVGTRASSGFRQLIDQALPDERSRGSLLFQLLDEMPVALLVSGHAIRAADVGMPPPPRRAVMQQADICAGWATGGTILSGLDANGLPPRVRGPEAPALELDDSRGWHEMSDLPIHGMRRRRRIDVWSNDGIVAVDAFFRDSHVEGDGVETVVHEYTIHAAIDPAEMRFLSCRAQYGVLPWLECPSAAASSERLAGAPVEGLRSWVRQNLTGPTTCTHLNDTLRALEDVGALLRATES